MIMTANGWKQLAPRNCIAAPKDRSLVEDMGLVPGQGQVVADQYCEAIQRFVRLPRSHPLSIDEQQMLGIISSKTVVPGFHVTGWPK